ncbi:MAG: hypothetical protein QOJ42_7955, partial [Acidobacteriaceae bacterium]|nr:hypothetical protein [Acidobacteriaceae bacterium]
MTLRHLLSHRAGFTHEAPVGNNYEPAFPDFEAHVRSISQTWLRYPVGERYRYSNLGFDLAGYILQVRTGMPFAECLRTLLFEPLGMNDSTAATDTYVQHHDRAVGHEKGKQLWQFVGNYVGRNITADITLHGQTLGIQLGSTFKLMQFVSPSETFVAGSDADTVTYHYCAAGHLEPAHF